MTDETYDNEPLMNEDAVGDAMLRYFEEQPMLLEAEAPARDLWAGIESRIGARVIPITQRKEAGARVARSFPAWLPMTLAAAALVAATSGVTYLVTRNAMTPAATTVASTTPQVQQQAQQQAHTEPAATAAMPAEPGVQHEAQAQVQLVSRRAGGPARQDAARTTYDEEITTLHAALESRRGQLDPATVATIEQNLRVIDNAIAQSKAALEKDPRSRMLNDQLDRSLAKKTDLLRAAALLPSV